jgi:hypothetical protein
MDNKLKQTMKTAQMAERMHKKAEQRKQEAAAAAAVQATNMQNQTTPAYTDAHLLSLFSDMGKPEKTLRSAGKPEDKKKKKKKA